ncbi:MAG: helix-turn-helix domain-containing protein [Pseudolabrys sp.]
MAVRTTLARNGTPRRSAAPPQLPPERPFDLTGTPLSFTRGEEIFGQGEPAEYIYRLISGCVRAYTTLNDGRRQVGAFYLPGDIFGLEARSVHNNSAESITHGVVQALKRSEFETCPPNDIVTTLMLLNLTTAELHRTQDHILLLLKSARERVIGFLLDLAKRQHNQNEIELPMSRQDIADYLGLTIETVSRTLTRLETAGVISMTGTRRLVLRDRHALTQLMA